MVEEKNRVIHMRNAAAFFKFHLPLQRFCNLLYKFCCIKNVHIRKDLWFQFKSVQRTSIKGRFMALKV